MALLIPYSCVLFTSVLSMVFQSRTGVVRPHFAFPIKNCADEVQPVTVDVSCASEKLSCDRGAGSKWDACASLEIPKSRFDELKSKNVRFRQRLKGFAHNEDGGILVLFTVLFFTMVLMVGFAMELALTEFNRAKLQNTTDSAGLAAADLEQSLDPTSVVKDFFRKAGLADNLGDVGVVEDDNGRTVTVDASLRQEALLTGIAGLDYWPVVVSGAARESRGDIEIAIALDNSTSMSWAPGATSGPASDPSRMDLLIPAAEAFVDAVQPQPGEKGSTTISLVPFATQVSPGADFLSFLNVTAEHSTSQCVTFTSASDFRTTVFSTTDLLQRTAHHDPVSNSGYGWRLNPDWTVCPTASKRDILAWSESVSDLKGKIRDMEPYGYTSIEIATKWAVSLLDPSLQPVLTSLSALDGYGYLDKPQQRGAPLAYNDPNSKKYLIVMSDGANTQNWDIKEPFRSGLSPVYKLSGTNNYVYYRNRSGSRDFYWVSRDQWRSSPGTSARQLTWQEVWGEMSVRKFVEDIKYKADTSRTAKQFYNEIVSSTSSNSKNNRTEDICRTARNAGITVFTIGMDTYGQGDATLLNCAGSTSNFYDVQGLDIAKAFESIARQINQLRLTQ